VSTAYNRRKRLGGERAGGASFRIALRWGGYVYARAARLKRGPSRTRGRRIGNRDHHRSLAQYRRAVWRRALLRVAAEGGFWRRLFQRKGAA
jgi:hypothetical protein